MQWMGKATKGLYQIDPGLDGIGRKGLELFNSLIVKREKVAKFIKLTQVWMELAEKAWSSSTV